MSTTTAAVVKVTPLVAVKKVVEGPEMREQFLRALPRQIGADKFIRILITTLTMNPDIAECSQRSVLAAAMKAAQDGLLLDGREAAIVKYGSEAQYLPMVAGILKKMRQSGEISSVSAHVVKENDEFLYELGDEEKIVHRPARSNRGATIGAYAIVRTKDDGIYRDFMDREQLEKVRGASRAKNGPWKDWYDEMAEKSVLKRIAKRCPSSADLQAVIDHANEVEGFMDKSALSAPPAEGRPRVLQQIVEAGAGDPPSDEGAKQTEDDAHACTEAQQKAIHTLLKKVGYESRGDEFAYISGFVGREVASTKDLSVNEACSIISDLDERAKMLAGGGK